MWVANPSPECQPPELITPNPHLHDEGVWNTAVALLGQLPGTEDAIQDAKRVASLPMKMGSLGLRSAVRVADAAYWASWADVTQMIGQRNPVVEDMAQVAPPTEQSLSELRGATDRLDSEGVWWRPNCRNLREFEPSAWRHCWQQRMLDLGQFDLGQSGFFRLRPIFGDLGQFDLGQLAQIVDFV